MKKSKAFTFSIIIHTVLLVGMVCAGLANKFFKKKPKETVNWVTMVQDTPAPPVKEVMPEQKDIKPPEPRVEKPPEPEIIKEPEKPKPKLKKKDEIKVNKNKVVRKQSPAPTPVVKQRKIIQKAKPLTPEQIKKMMGVPTTRKVTNQKVKPQDIDWSFFYAMLQEKLYAAWVKPRGVPTSYTATVWLKVDRSGKILERRLQRPSGNTTLDQSVMKAAQNVTYIAALPSNYREMTKDVTIEFEITD